MRWDWIADTDIPSLAISKTSGLQDALDGKLNKSGDVATGTIGIKADGATQLRFYRGVNPTPAYQQYGDIRWLTEDGTSVNGIIRVDGDTTYMRYLISLRFNNTDYTPLIIGPTHAICSTRPNPGQDDVVTYKMLDKIEYITEVSTNKNPNSASWSWRKYNTGRFSAWRYMGISTGSNNTTTEVSLPFTVSGVNYLVFLNNVQNNSVPGSEWAGALRVTERTTTTFKIFKGYSDAATVAIYVEGFIS